MKILISRHELSGLGVGTISLVSIDANHISLLQQP
jgi:hypothetical protein